uniref:(northern house mosquito) hypothetical protein n=1 Tax=Culex pipiens TaxID=7175 RepID=A0A8D8NVA1_CULPI
MVLFEHTLSHCNNQPTKNPPLFESEIMDPPFFLACGHSERLLWSTANSCTTSLRQSWEAGVVSLVQLFICYCSVSANNHSLLQPNLGVFCKFQVKCLKFAESSNILISLLSDKVSCKGHLYVPGH